MKRTTSLVSVLLFAFVGAPLAASAADPATPATGTEVKAGVKAETGAKAKVDKAKGDAKGHVDHMKGHAKDAKNKAHKATGAAAEKANSAASDATGKAKAKVDAEVPGMGASGEAEAGGAAK